MTTITAPDTLLAPKHAHTAVSRRTRRPVPRSAFSELREQTRQRTLMVVAITAGIVSVTVTASAAVVIGLAA